MLISDEAENNYAEALIDQFQQQTIHIVEQPGSIEPQRTSISRFIQESKNF